MTKNKKVSLKEQKSEFIDINKILSRGAIMNFIISARGPGKSWAAKARSLERWLLFGEQFIYVRRTQEEVELTKHGHFDDILIEKYKGSLEMKVKADKFLIRKKAEEGEQNEPWQIVGWAIAVSRQQAYKSTAFPMVTTIYYDEFIPDNPWSRTNPREVFQFLSLVETVARYRENVKVLLLSNTGFIANPYFQNYDIKPKDFLDKEFVYREGGNVCFWFYRFSGVDKAVAEKKISSKIGGAAFRESSVEGNFRDLSHEFVGEKPYGSSVYCNFVANEKGTRYFRVRFSSLGWWVDEGKKYGDVDTYLFDQWTLTGDEEAWYDAKAIKALTEAWNKRVIKFSAPEVKLNFIEKLYRS